MIKFSFSGETYQTGRIIGNIEGTEPGPVLMFIAGIHGNEPTGVLALQQVFEELAAEQTPICGHVIGVSGNLNALAKNTRFISKDLNRIWNRDGRAPVLLTAVDTARRGTRGPESVTPSGRQLRPSPDKRMPCGF